MSKYISPEEVDKLYLEEAITNKIKNGDGQAFYYIGRKYYRKKEFHKAFCWFLLSADRQFSKAHYELGNMYCTGDGVEKDKLTGFKRYIKAAKMFDKEAWLSIAYLLLGDYDDVISTNNHKALEWFFKYNSRHFMVQILEKELHSYLPKQDKNKPFKRLLKETEDILNTEIKKRKEEENEMERALAKQMEIYKLKKSRKPTNEELRKNFDPFIFHPKRK